MARSGRAVLVGALFGAAVLVTACGSGGSTSAPTTDAPVSSTAGTTPSTVAPAGTEPAASDSPQPITRGDAAVARAQWVSTGIASYSWRLSRQCMCDSAPLVVVVQDGQVATVTLAETGGAPSDEQVELDAATVEELFGWIDDAFAEGRQVRASFDPDLGFPTRVEADGLMPEAGLFMTAEDLIPST